ncbi:MAG: ceramidase domain-containing protein [Pseudomonadota bacterium]
MEGWTTQIDIYCERLGPGLWAEPINAVSNLAFILAALIMWRRARGDTTARALAVILAAIGLTSGLWHLAATRWAVALDVASIAAFVLVYIQVANRRYWSLSPVWATVATAGFFPFTALTGPAFAALPFFEVSAGYWPIALLIAIYAVALARRAPETAGRLGIGAGILALSLAFRSVDEAVCSSIPIGTHFMWHILNGVMLAWMIETVLRHRPSDV